MCNCNTQPAGNGQKAVDLTKPVQTRSGCPVRILCTDRKGGDFPVAALLMTADGSESYQSYTAEGRVYTGEKSSALDLINAPPKVVSDHYLNVCLNSFGCNHLSRDRAKRVASDGVLGQVRVTTFDDGTFTIEKHE